MSLGRTPESGGGNVDVSNAIVAHASSSVGLTPRRMAVAVHCAALVGSAVRYEPPHVQTHIQIQTHTHKQTNTHTHTHTRSRQSFRDLLVVCMGKPK